MHFSRITNCFHLSLFYIACLISYLLSNLKYKNHWNLCLDYDCIKRAKYESWNVNRTNIVFNSTLIRWLVHGSYVNFRSHIHGRFDFTQWFAVYSLIFKTFTSECLRQRLLWNYSLYVLRMEYLFLPNFCKSWNKFIQRRRETKREYNPKSCINAIFSTMSGVAKSASLTSKLHLWISTVFVLRSYTLCGRWYVGCV